ncbi:MAG: hypothetical protein HPY90_07705 [Syntrophothermus sp.]|uniref:hypothetical protein n=1 Tax=Syntrophothermus sp. TaxID=2736299 RepID=UPI00257D0E12|nr:hypothetical protein [Syntrophothermus sp.]NSW83146.1 hypothetical protein [Syntrophothermus sp.]
MVNPIVTIREELGFDRRKFALALGVSYATLQAHENGLVRVVQPAVKRGLAALGVDSDLIEQDYTRWREEQGRQIREA